MEQERDQNAWRRRDEQRAASRHPSRHGAHPAEARDRNGSAPPGRAPEGGTFADPTDEILRAIADLEGLDGISGRRESDPPGALVRPAEESSAAADRLRALCAQSSDYVGLTDSEGRLLYLNDAARALLEMPPDEDLHRARSEDLYASISRGRLGEVRRAAESGSDTWTGEMLLRTRRGTEVPIRQTITAHRNGTGAIEFYSTVGHAIASEELVEQEIARSEARYRALVESSYDAVLVVDRSARIRYVGPTMERLTGFTAGDLLGEAALRFVDESSRAAVEEAFAEVLRSEGSVGPVVMRGHDNLGRERFYETVMTNRLDDPHVNGVVLNTRDVTERQQMEDALRTSEERFRSLAEWCPVGVVYADDQARVTYVNQRWADICGTTREELLGVADWRIAHPDDRDRITRETVEAMMEGREYRGTFRVLRPDGSLRHVRSLVRKILNDDGTAQGFVAIQEDVTDEYEARGVAERLTALLASTPDLAGVIDREGRLVFLNEGARRIFGIPFDTPATEITRERIGMTEASRRVVETEMRETLARDGVWRGELVYLTADGREVPVSQISLAHRGPDGELEYASAIARDITERKEIERRIAESEAWYRSLVQHGMDVVTVQDADLGLRYVSPASMNMLGARAEDLDESALAALVHEQDLPSVLQAYQQVREGAEAALTVEYRVRHADRGWRVFESRITNLLDDPIVAGIVTNTRDITENRRAEQARRRSEAVLRTVVQSSPVAIFAIDRDGAVQLWNPAAEQLFGWTAEELVGMPLRAEHNPYREAFDDWRAQVFAGETIRNLELVRERSDGSPVQISLSVAPVRDAEGRVVAAMGVVLDIGDRVRAETARRRAARYDAMLAETSHALMGADTDGIDEVVAAALGKAADLIGADGASLYRVGDDGRGFLRTYEWSAPGTPALASRPIDGEGEQFGHFQAALEREGAFLLCRHEFPPGAREVERLDRLGAGAVAAVGVRAGEVTTGVLAFMWRHAEPRRDEIDFESLRLLGDVISTTLDRRRAERALRASEERFRAIAEHSSDLVLVYGADGVVRYLSPSAARYTGFAVGQGMEGDAPLAHPDDLEMTSGVFAEIVDAGTGATSRPFEARVRRHDGEYRSLELVATNLLDDPVVGGIVVNARDVTERRLAEDSLREINDALRESNATMRTIVDSSPLGIYTVDAAGLVRLWNPACEAMYGWTAEEVLGRHLPTIPSEGFDAADGVLRAVLAGESVTGLEVTRQTKDGRSLEVSVSAAPMRDGTGAVTGMLGVVVDMTHRRHAEQALRESEERFRALVQNASDLIVVLDGEGKVQWTSPSNERALGYGEGFGMGMDSFEFVHPDDLDLVAETMAKVFTEPGSVGPITIRVRHADGSWRLVEAVATNLLDNPAVGGVVVTSRDVTERNVAEEALRRNQERFQALVQNLSDVITVVGPNSQLLYTSPAAERLFGFAEGDDSWTNPLGKVHPDDVDRVGVEIGEQLASDGPPRPVAFRIQAADGSWHDVEVVAQDMFEDPAVGGLVVTTRDVSDRRNAERELRRSEARYRAIVEDQTELVCRYGPDGLLTFANEAYVRFFGAPSADAIVGTRFVPPMVDADRPVIDAALTSIARERPVATVEHRVASASGVRWLQWTTRGVFDSHGELLEYQAVGRDVTERKRAEAIVADQARILKLIAQGAPLAETLATMCAVVEAHAPDAICSVMLVDETGETLDVVAGPSLDEAYKRALVGVPIGPDAGSCGSAAFLGEAVTVSDIATDPRWEPYREVALEHGLRACWSTPVFASSGDRVLGTFAVYYRTPREPLPEHEQVVAMVTDLGAIAIERKAFEDRLAHQAHHDPLTGLPNRVLFVEFLTLALARARRHHTGVAVLFMDLDRFKNVNDSLGHDAGDELLVKLADRIRSVLRPGDTVARFGGDEFVVLCEDLSAGAAARQQAADVADRVLDAIAAPFPLNGEPTHLTASIGIALASPSDRPESLLRDADAAMYRAKEQGKARWELFDEEMRSSARVRLETENALHRAIDGSEFRIHYQPLVDLTRGRCVGAEALVRWQHPERGLVSPQEFITLAEETGLIVPIGTWVLEEACRQVASWSDELPLAAPFSVSINLSARQLAQPDLVDRVALALARTGAPPGMICLEITESVLMADMSVESIRALKALGVRVSIDDFGTGYSSLGYLKRFPVDILKVDRSFVDGLGSDPEDSAIVAAVVSLGHALGLTVVAEGVETEGQLVELVRLGCDQAQGFFYAPARPPEEFVEFVRDDRAHFVPRVPRPGH